MQSISDVIQNAVKHQRLCFFRVKEEWKPIKTKTTNAQS